MILLIRIITMMVFVSNAWLMKKEYDKQNLVGVIYWGFMTLLFAMALN